MEKIIVTRHPALIKYLEEMRIIDGNERVITHATEEDVRGKDVIGVFSLSSAFLANSVIEADVACKDVGVLPLSLASLANSVTEVTLNLTPVMIGEELSLKDIRSIAGEIIKYAVLKEKTWFKY